MDDTADIQAGMTGGLSSRLDSKGATPARTSGGSFYGNPNMGK